MKRVPKPSLLSEPPPLSDPGRDGVTFVLNRSVGFESSHRCPPRIWKLSWTLAILTLASCETAPKPGAHQPRTGDEIVVAGQFFHTGTPVVLWMDPGGYDAYRVERRFSPLDKADWENSHGKNKDLTSPNRYGLRRA